MNEQAQIDKINAKLEKPVTDRPKVMPGNKSFWGMNHLNGNLLCAVDTETTGFSPEKNGIIEICILPLNSRLDVHENFPMFHMRMKPEEGEEIDPDALRVTQMDLARIMLEGFQRDTVADYVMNWFETLGLPAGKKVVPLAHNWPFDRLMIQYWLGEKSFEHIFHGQFRDLMSVALYLNDCADARAEQVPFSKVGLRYVCNLLKVEHLKAHTAIGDCMATAQCYKKILSFRPGLL